MQEHLLDAVLQGLSEDTGDFWIDQSVPVLDNPDPIAFLRAVCAYHPVIIRGAIDHWDALHRWNSSYLVDILGDRTVAVNLTPDGHGDCVKYVDTSWLHLDLEVDASSQSSNEQPTTSNTPTDANNMEPYFVYPAESDMRLSSFFDLLEDRDRSIVPYLSQQNDNVRTSMPELLRDIDSSLLLANAAFDALEPEAINLWIGDERSVSSLHKDHFENMYAVVSGEKTFTLFPPTDAAFLPEGEFPTLRYCLAEDDGEPSMRLGLSSAGCDFPTLRWIHYDPDADCPHHRGSTPVLSSQFAHPLRCTLSAGEVLYIPAMWYHRVSQTCHTVAVNYWYDQRFDFRYVFYQTVKRISAAVEIPISAYEKSSSV